MDTVESSNQYVSGMADYSSLKLSLNHRWLKPVELNERKMIGDE